MFVDDFLVPLEQKLTELSTIEELSTLKVSIKATIQQNDILEQGIDLEKLQQILTNDIQVVYPDLVQQYEAAKTQEERVAIH